MAGCSSSIADRLCSVQGSRTASRRRRDSRDVRDKIFSPSSSFCSSRTLETFSPNASSSNPSSCMTPVDHTSMSRWRLDMPLNVLTVINRISCCMTIGARWSLRRKAQHQSSSVRSSRVGALRDEQNSIGLEDASVSLSKEELSCSRILSDPVGWLRGSLTKERSALQRKFVEPEIASPCTFATNDCCRTLEGMKATCEKDQKIRIQARTDVNPPRASSSRATSDASPQSGTLLLAMQQRMFRMSLAFFALTGREETAAATS
mmetsp:Transcript_34374/g.77466  ORF Transcript_34374/g.77466 Transcript_34374/m.77466 type:complete len:262 (+) Transcript_34374:250-1035(+)